LSADYARDTERQTSEMPTSSAARSSDGRTPRRQSRGHCWRRHPDSNRGISALQALALPLGYAAILLCCDVLLRESIFSCYRDCYRRQRLSTGKTLHLGLDHPVRQPRIALSRDDRAVTEELLKGD
jgi:hypothetical protein